MKIIFYSLILASLSSNQAFAGATSLIGFEKCESFVVKEIQETIKKADDCAGVTKKAVDTQMPPLTGTCGLVGEQSHAQALAKATQIGDGIKTCKALLSKASKYQEDLSPVFKWAKSQQNCGKQLAGNIEFISEKLASVEKNYNYYAVRLCGGKGAPIKNASERRAPITGSNTNERPSATIPSNNSINSESTYQ